MFIHEIREGRATLHLYQDDSRLLANLLADIQHRDAEPYRLTVEALVCLFQALTTALSSTESLACVMGEEPTTPPRYADNLSNHLAERHIAIMQGNAFAAHGIGDGAIGIYDPEGHAAPGDWVVYRTGMEVSGGERAVGILRGRVGANYYDIDTPDGMRGIIRQNLIGPIVGVLGRPAPAPTRAAADAA